MAAKILDGNAISKDRRGKLKEAIAKKRSAGNPEPGLAVMLVGNNPASEVYVQKKQAACAEVGIKSQCDHFPENVDTETLLTHIAALNHSPDIHGILVQLPLPKQIDTTLVLNSILPEKDIDGFHPMNIGKLALNQPGLRSCTPQGIMNLLSQTDISLPGAQACVVGASNIVGKPMAMMLLNAEATVTQCHIRTQNLREHIQRADLLVVAIGQPNFIQGEWLKPGVVVIDVGINRLPNGRLTGDVDFDQASQKASWITPVPGGVGPMTVTTLLENTFAAYSTKGSGGV